jgi:hypothetical protein
MADGQGRRVLAREGITTWAAASDLVLQFGWQADAVRVESEMLAFDFIGFDTSRGDPGRKALLVGEAKARSAAVLRQVEEMRRCEGAHPEEHREWPAKKVAHHKCEGMMRELSRTKRSVYFWGVAPGVRFGLLGTMRGDSLTLEDAGWPPSRVLL